MEVPAGKMTLLSEDNPPHRGRPPPGICRSHIIRPRICTRSPYVTHHKCSKQSAITHHPWPSIARHMWPCPHHRLVLVTLLVFALQLSYVQASKVPLKFTSSQYNTTVPENAMGNTAVASDIMMGMYLPTSNAPVIRYRIMNGDPDNFFKTSSNVIGGFCFLEIHVRTNNRNVLNRESRNMFKLQIKAQRRNNDRSKDDIPGAVSEVTIRITDINDLRPFFLNQEYRFRISEDMPLHSAIGMVKAEDPDEGLNGDVYYKFKESTRVFAVHPTSGVISLTRPLRFLEQSYYELTIEAKDRGVKQRGGWPVTSRIYINVTEENIYDPQIKITKLQEAAPRAHLAVVAIINVVDNDRGPSGEVRSLEVVEGDPDRVFRILPTSAVNEFNLAGLDTIDWNDYSYGFNLTLKATDGGSRQRFSYRVIRIAAPSSKNDQESVFSREYFEVSIDEMAPVGTQIVQIGSWVPGAQKTKQYSILAGNKRGQFQMNPASGVLTLAKPLDFESQVQYSLTVVAGTASMRPHQQSTAKISITILDANDNTPIIVAPQGTVKIDEHQPAGTWVTKVRAQDYDTEENGYVAYSLANSDEVPFTVDHVTGEVRTTHALDYETEKRTWHLLVRASDWGSPFRRQSEKVIRVQLQDINDNRPQFERTDCSGHIDRSAPLGSEIVTLSAIDFDQGNIISYRIVGGNSDRCFSIDTTSGVLTLTCDLSDLRSSERYINVTATDGQHFADTLTVRLQLVHQRKADVWASIDCKDMGVAKRLGQQLAIANEANKRDDTQTIVPSPQLFNAHRPEIQLPEEVGILENREPGEIILNITAIDPDSGYEGYLSYAISDGNHDSVFKMDPYSGVLKVAGILDREDKSRYILNITVYDAGSPRFATSRRLIVNILDENDNPPQFDKAAYSFFLPESVANGTSVYELVAHDPDEGINGVVTYSLATDTPDFALDAVTGRLSVSRPLDHEKQSTYELRAVARDGGGRSSYAYVTIQVANVNDCPPTFPVDHSKTAVRVPEDLPVGALITLVPAHDPDSPKLHYNLHSSPDHQGMFSLDPETAALRLAAPLDYENRPAYNITVWATDDGSPPLKAHSHVIIQVVDVNENVYSPTFDQDVLETSVSEDAKPHTFVASVTATDKDKAPLDSYVTYRIIGEEAHGVFYIDQKGGIYTQSWLDRETTASYWFTVRAEDAGTVPRHSTLHVYVEIEDVNDHRPLSPWPVYWPVVMENSPPGTTVVNPINASDPDPGADLTYAITAGNPQSLFSIETKTGEIRTTERRLDREHKSQHDLEVTIMDGDEPDSLSSQTFISVTVMDDNDHTPHFLQRIYKFNVPLKTHQGDHLQAGQNISFLESEHFLPYNPEQDLVQEQEEEDGSGGYGTDLFVNDMTTLPDLPLSFLNLSTPHSGTSEGLVIMSELEYMEEGMVYKAIARVVAVDEDAEDNGDITYSLQSNEWLDLFTVNPKTGVIYSKPTDLDPQADYELTVEASDGGQPAKLASCLVVISVVPVPSTSPNPPTFLESQTSTITVLETDPVGHHVKLVNVEDKDGDILWFDIIDGNSDNMFSISSDSGSIMVAGHLDAETLDLYNLTVTVTDGVHLASCQIVIRVLDVNDNRPSFSLPLYEVEVRENTSPGTTVFTLTATDPDKDQHLTYTLLNTAHISSIAKFSVNPTTGDIVLQQYCDREVREQHTLTVMVKDRITPIKKDYARVIISIVDYNDHAPEFLVEQYTCTVMETSLPGTRVTQVLAFDHDKGANGRITYSIVSGNIDGVFSLDASTGVISLSGEVDRQEQPEYWLAVRATDNGGPPKHSHVNVNILVRMAVDAPPRFKKSQATFDVSENAQVGDYLGVLEVESHLGVVFTILSPRRLPFSINPATGILAIDAPLDFEIVQSYNFTVTAVSMNKRESSMSVVVNIVDENDNIPYFSPNVFSGHISEAASMNSVVLADDNTPLVIKAADADSGINANLIYSILDEDAKNNFTIDSSTGSIRTVGPLNHESVSSVQFSVSVQDSGSPSLTASTTAHVTITITDINDVPPNFLMEFYNATLFTPTYMDVSVVQLNATDLDFDGKSILEYGIADGNNDGKFEINRKTGLITVRDPEELTGVYHLKATVSDGEFESSTSVSIHIESLPSSGLRFSQEKYFAAIEENSTAVARVTMVQVLGTALNEHLKFSILNPSDIFLIGKTSGVIHTTGKPLDREQMDNYLLVVEVESLNQKSISRKVAHVQVHVVVLDKNDNYPIFVNTPYYGVVSVDAKEGQQVFRVQATDFDADENSDIHYELHRGNGDLFSVDLATGSITLKKSLEGLQPEYELLITAYDGGSPSLSSQIGVHLKVVDRSQPIFDQQFYSAAVLENSELYTPVITLNAISQLNRKLIYTITGGNHNQTFDIDHETGTIRVQDSIDYESKSSYQLTVRAADSYSGKWAEVILSIQITDINDNPPEFLQYLYQLNVSEATSIATPILTVTTSDRDTGPNAGVSYQVMYSNGTVPPDFYISSDSGVLMLRQSLDREVKDVYNFLIVATDMGTPPLSTTANVRIHVVDMNDNAPVFEQRTQRCEITEGARKGHFVSQLSAWDADITDLAKLTYSIVDGNENQVFAIIPSTGGVTVWNPQKLLGTTHHILNVSVSDGVFTAYTPLAVAVTPVNDHSPTFRVAQFEAQVMENDPIGTKLMQVSATDEDSGRYGEVTYHFVGDKAQKYFRINENTGEIWTSEVLNCESQSEYSFTIMAMDIGGRSGFTTLHVVVGDMNDNKPKFQQAAYKALVMGNATIGTLITKVWAEDLDMGEYGQVSYEVHNSTPKESQDAFAIDANTGELTLKQNALQLKSTSYEFFLVARDSGSPSLHSTVTVSLQVINGETPVPEFLSRRYTLTVLEDTKPGSVIGLVSARFSGSVQYSVSWNEGEISPPVTVSGDGTLKLSGLLDHEDKNRLILRISAEPIENPDLKQETTVVIEVQDVNDMIPVFESEKYYISVAENTPIGANIIRAVASDGDSGSNGEVRYSLEDRLTDPFFIIDPYSGWLQLNHKLHFENKNKYEIKVLAQDGGEPQQTSTTSIIVQVVNYNDNAPTFSKNKYNTTVSEDALPGTVVAELEVANFDQPEDPADLKNNVEYYITRGNELQHFHVRSGGQIYAAKPLDRESIERYILEVTATDGNFVTTAHVTISVIDVNDNGPLCTTPRYQHTISESAELGTILLQVSASDPDLLGYPTFYLTGPGAGDFYMDQSLGQLSVHKELDREKQEHYSLKVAVRDSEHEDWECNVQIKIDVTDVNDNAPIFSQKTYSVNVPENSPENLLLLKVHASDPDHGVNGQISYSVEGSDIFVIDSINGIISVTETLDRESQAMYNLTVRATDHGTPPMVSHTNILVLVSDVNDNPPEFASHTYYTTITESSNIGSEVVRVLATSRDSGKNAEIAYSIIGGNEHRKFTIHSKTGVVSVQDHLDYERAHTYQLTIQAMDGGEPPLSNHATVNVTITDINDNAPIFIQNSYSAIVNEAAMKGEKLIQVVATDLDSGVNGKIQYGIGAGDPSRQFEVDKLSGWVRVASDLDRESQGSYSLEVVALDDGIPQQSGSVILNIDISDANDNPPVFVDTNHTAHVKEDSPINSLVYKFEVIDNDDDAARNGGPFTFELRSGNQDTAFRITQHGELRTATRFKSRRKDLYRLQIRVYDNGSPPLYSETWTDVMIIPESQYPPVVYPLSVNVFVQSEDAMGYLLGSVKATDEDPYDTLTYSIAADKLGVSAHYFNINPKDGTLSATGALDEGYYTVNISVTDGKFTKHSQADVEVVDIEDEMIRNAVILRLSGATPEEFLLSYKRHFHRAVKNILNVKSRDVVILSLQESENRERRDTFSKKKSNKKDLNKADVDILFAVHRSTKGYYPRNVVRKKLELDMRTLQNGIGLVVVDIVDDSCSINTCDHGHCEERVILDDEQVAITTEHLSFVSLHHHHESVCICPQGFSGARCDIVINQCAHRPCPSYQICIPETSSQGYLCKCPEGFVGYNCSRPINKCLGEESNKPECYAPISPLSFKGKSYAQYSLHNPIERHFSFSMWFRTLHPSGNLMFTSGRIDYSILEVSGGEVRYRWDLGSGEGLVAVTAVHVNDGHWHHISLERFSSTAEVRVDGQHRAQGSSPGSSDLLNLESPHLYLGAEVRPWAGAQDPRWGLVGCIDDPRIDNEPLPLSHTASSKVASLSRLNGVSPNCLALSPAGVCGSHPCLNGGTCREEGASFTCQCHPRFQGARCEFDSNPCASSPCLNNGHCVNFESSYRCECPARVSGPRCQYMYCNPNPCLNRGVCEEGILGPICKCRGFTGAYCNIDINECSKNPCQNGGSCVNTYGSFQCMCPGNATGTYCDALPSTLVGLEGILYIGIGIGIVVVLALVTMVAVCCHQKRMSKRRRLLNQTNHVIIKPKNMDSVNIYKRNAKITNLEASHNPNSCTPRPDSFPTSSVEPAYMPLNNFDTIRSYGSAGDELENLPQYSREFMQNIAKGSNSLNCQGYASHPPLSVNVPPGTPRSATLSTSASTSNMVVDADCLHKPWKDALANNLKDTYYDRGKIQNDVKFRKGEYMSLKKIGVDGTYKDDASIRSEGSVDDQQGIAKSSTVQSSARSLVSSDSLCGDQLSPKQKDTGYHWDCSDWAGQNPLPNIMEVPGGEVRDSSSYHSNESNESSDEKTDVIQPLIPPDQGPVDASRDMETLVADESISELDSEFELDSRTDLHSSQMLDLDILPSDPGAESESDTSFFMPHPQRYESHPNQYLPQYQISESGTEISERSKLLNTFEEPMISFQQSPISNFINGYASPPLSTSNGLPGNMRSGIMTPDDLTSTNLDDLYNPLQYLPQEFLPQDRDGATYSPYRVRRNNKHDTVKRFSEFGSEMAGISGTEDEERTSLWGGDASNTSASDLDNVCDIDDSEVNSEFENDDKTRI